MTEEAPEHEPQHQKQEEARKGRAVVGKGNGRFDPHLWKVHALSCQQTDGALLADSVKCLDTHEDLPQLQLYTEAGALATARVPAVSPLLLYLRVRRQRLQLFRQQLRAFHQMLHPLQHLQRASETLLRTFAAAASRLVRSRQHLLPLLQRLQELRQQEQQAEEKTLLCEAILSRFALSQVTLEALTCPLPSQAASEAETAVDLAHTREALHQVLEKRQRLQSAAAAATADLKCSLLDDLLQHTKDLRDVGYERLFLLVLLALQQLAAAATSTRLNNEDGDEAVAAAFQALTDLARRQRQRCEDQHQQDERHMAQAIAAVAIGEAQGAKCRGGGALLWQALADLHDQPAYLLQCIQQVLRLRRQVLQQRFRAVTWEPQEFTCADVTSRPLKNALEWVSRAAKDEAAVCVCLLQLLYYRGGSMAVGVQQLQQQQLHKQPHEQFETSLQFSASDLQDDKKVFLRCSADQGKLCGADETAVPIQQQYEQPLYHQQLQEAERHFQPEQQQHQKQQTEMQPPSPGWLPFLEALVLPSEAGSSAAMLSGLLSPLSLINAVLEVLHGPLAARLSKILHCSDENSNSNTMRECGILAIKAALLLQQHAANIEKALGAAVAEAPRQHFERQHQQQQGEQQKKQPKPMLAEFLLGLADEALRVFDMQWNANALQLPPLSAAAAENWLPAFGSAEPRTSTLPLFLTQFAARLQDLVLAHVTCLASGEQQPPQQQQQHELQQQHHGEALSMQQLEAVIGRDVPRVVNYCLQGAQLMYAPRGCVFILTALCCLRSALEPELAPPSSVLEQQQQVLQQILFSPVLQQQRRLLSQLIEEKTAELCALQANQLCDAFGITMMLEALEVYTEGNPEEAPRSNIQLLKAVPRRASLMSREVAEDLLSTKSLEAFFSSFMAKVYGSCGLELPLLRCLPLDACRPDVRSKVLEALVEGYAAVADFAVRYTGLYPSHTPEQVRLLLDL
ncbi:hypothetical protein Efla_001668 [Eimeria flavescens]